MWSERSLHIAFIRLSNTVSDPLKPFLQQRQCCTVNRSPCRDSHVLSLPGWELWRGLLELTQARDSLGRTENNICDMKRDSIWLFFSGDLISDDEKWLCKLFKKTDEWRKKSCKEILFYFGPILIYVTDYYNTDTPMNSQNTFIHTNPYCIAQQQQQQFLHKKRHIQVLTGIKCLMSASILQTYLFQECTNLFRIDLSKIAIASY